MVKAILLGFILIFTFCLNTKGQIVYCTDEADITRVDASTFVFNKKDQNQSSTKFIEITRGGVSIPYNTGNVACLDYYVELSKAGTETQTMDAVKFASDPAGYLAKGCYPSTITISSEIHAIGNINLHDNSVVTNAPTMSGFQGNDIGSATVLKLAFMDFGWSSAMTNALIEEFDLKIVIKDHCNNQEKELFLPAGSWKVLETMRKIDLEGGVKVEIPDLAICKNDASTSVTASVTGITNPYTVSWAANAGSNMPTGVTYSSSGTGKTNDVFNINPSLATAGTYKIRATVTDDADNSITADTVFEVKVHPALQVAITTDESGNGGVCESLSVHLSATPTGADYTYKWTHTPTFGTDINMTIASADSNSVTGTLAGVSGGGSRKYIVEVTNTVTGCSATADTTIVVKKKPNIKLEINGSTANTLAVCSGEPVTLTASNVTVADESRTTYQWITPTTGGSTNPLIVYPTAATTYEVKGTVDGCSMTVQKQVTINPKPEINVTHNPSSVCASTLGGSGMVNLTTVGITSSVNLNNREYFQALGGIPLANPNSVTLSVGTHNFWLVGTTTEGCKDTVTFTAKVNDLPAKPVITGGQEVCDGKNVNLSIQSPVANSTYDWKNGGGISIGSGTTLTSYAPSSTENLSVTVKDGNGCQNTSDSYGITVNNLPSITFRTNPAVACAGETVSISANITGGSGSYNGHTWTGVANVASDGMSADLLLDRGTTSFALTVKDTKGCEATGGNSNAYGHYVNVTLSAGGTVNIGSPVALTTTTEKDGVAVPPNSTVEWTFKDDNTNTILCGPTQTSNSCNPIVTALTRYKVEVRDVNTGCTDWDTITPNITPGAPLNVDPVTQPVLCYGETDFSGKYFLVKATNGLPAYTYSWTDLPSWMTWEDKGDTLKITGIDWTQAVTTSVKSKVTDQAGDSKETILTLTIRSLTRLAINSEGNNGELRTCQHSGTNDQYALNVTKIAGANLTSVKWLAPTGVSVNANPLNISTSTANVGGINYKVTAVDANGCPTDTVAVNVIIDALPNPGTLTAEVGGTSVKDGAVCPNTAVDIAAIGTSGVSQVSYLWSNGATTSITTWSPSTSDSLLILTVTDKYCSVKDTVKVNTYTPETLVLSADRTTVCKNSSNVTLTVSGLTGGTYSWSSQPTDGTLSVNNVTTQNVVPTVTTTYYVDGTDVHGCSVEQKSIVVTVDEMPTFNLSEHKLVACGAVKLYDAVGAVSSGATLKYGTTAGFAGGTVVTSTTMLPASGLYYVRAENGTCKSDEDTVRVNILTAPQLKLLATTMKNCEPDSIDLADNIDWTGTTFDVTNLTYWEGGTQLTSTKVYPGVTTKTYSVRGTSTGCPLETKDVTVTIHPKPVLEISVNDTAVCTPTADLNVAVNAKDGLAVTKTYFSDVAYTSPVASAVSSGTYYVIGETAAGCKDSIDVTVRVKPHPVVTLAVPDDMVCENEPVSLTVNGGATGDTYSWKVDGVSVAETSNSYTSPALTASSSIEVTVTNTEGCTTVLDTTIGIYKSTVSLVASGNNCLGETVTITATLAGDGNATGYSWTGATQTATANEATLTLTAAGQIVEVEVTTDKGCTVKGKQEFKGRPCGVLVVEVPDTMVCLSGDDVILTAHSFGGTVTDWTWKQIAGSSMGALTFTDSVLTLPATGMTVGETYRFEVSVNGGAAKDTADVTIQQGVEITSLVALDSCSDQVILQVTAVNATTYYWDVVTGNGIGYNVPGSPGKWELRVDGGHTEYTVAVKASNGVCEAHDTLRGHILDVGLNLAFGANDTCGKNIQLPISYGVNGGFGDVVVKYSYQPQNGLLTEDSIRITPPAVPSLPAQDPGIYVLTTAYATNAPGCVVTVNDTLKIGALPEVELDENCLALHKDSTFNLNIVNTGDFDYIWSVLESSDGVTWTAGGSGDGTTASTVNGSMEDKDLQYIITATDRNLPQCKASDTAHIYRIPDAPVIDIDTIGDHYHAQVIWTPSSVADGYTVWSRRWDPYCLTTAYTGDTIYHAEPTGTNIPDTSWAEPTMDSLKFFYVTADINVCGSWYNSLSSADTVGYKLDSIHKQPTGSSKGSNNMISWMFDMSAKGVVISDDVFIRGGMGTACASYNINAIRKWINIPNATSSAAFSLYTTPNMMACMIPTLPPFTTGGNPAGNVGFTLRVGDSYQFEAKNPTQLLQYGKLERVIQRIDTVAVAAQNNVFASPFHKAYLKGIEDILIKEITKDVISTVRMWDFSQQNWIHYVQYNSMHDMIPTLPAVTGSKGPGTAIPVFPGEALQIEFIKGNMLYPDSYIWY